MTKSTINWIIAPTRGGLKVTDRERQIATILTTGDTWTVEFEDHPNLSFSWTGKEALSICIGYVRGIERVTIMNRYVGKKDYFVGLEYQK